MRDPYEVLGVDRKAAQPTSRARFASLRKNCIPTPTKTIRRRRRALPKSTPRTKFSARRTSARRSTAARSTPKASRASAGSKDLAAPAPGPARRRLRPGANSKTSILVPKASPATARRGRGGAGAGGFEDILSEAFGRGAAGRRAGANSSPRISASAPMSSGADGVAAGRGQRRHPAPAAAHRQGCRGENSGRHHQRPANPARGPGHGRARRRRRPLIA